MPIQCNSQRRGAPAGSMEKDKKCVHLPIPFFVDIFFVFIYIVCTVFFCFVNATYVFVSMSAESAVILGRHKAALYIPHCAGTGISNAYLYFRVSKELEKNVFRSARTSQNLSEHPFVRPFVRKKNLNHIWCLMDHPRTMPNPSLLKKGRCLLSYSDDEYEYKYKKNAKQKKFHEEWAISCQLIFIFIFRQMKIFEAGRRAQ